MDSLTPNDLSHLSDEEFNALAPQGYHATGPAEPQKESDQEEGDCDVDLTVNARAWITQFDQHTSNHL